MSHWQNHAACAGHPDPDLFTNGHRAHEAKRVCARCPVIEPCRAEGRAASVGTWGGKFHEQKTVKSLTLPFLELVGGQ
jgi:WhiB family redox-sensing transcriptional regulator